ncbi:site-specific integrase [Sphingomonas koreensis]|uniref:tyrosine-type recombinase/integrase n=1 Tax=Sphingomonas koreensis TaxID=93064 RepID=UPI0008326433|nr:site-specific integrase [Sphingomonas koreensis]PJI89037.1 site-specific recombinase XerD [Sphingomonas koreensis]RSU63381.1 site-specific integrase [Sphingomonas koreensis]RSU71046.1 site-specific integrase [Sphingomonas koreensis]
MSVYKPKRKPYYLYDFVWNGQRYHGSTGLESKRDALAYESIVRRDAILGINQKLPITLDEACGLYEDHAKHLPSWPSIEGFLERLIAGLGGTRFLHQIGQADLQEFVARRRGEVSNASVNREIDNARAVWRRVDGLRRYNVGEMPDWSRLYLKVANRPPRELSFDEEDNLFSELRDDLVDAVDFALQSGWRLGEVIGLRWSDLNLQTAQAQTRIKGGDVVKRPLTAALVALVARQPKVGPMVFTYVAQRTKPEFIDKRGRTQPGRKKGERYPLTKTALRKPFAAAKAAGGIDGFRFHDLRHTRGTRIVRTTGSLAAAKEALKHRNIKTTLRYAHVLDEDVRSALAASDSRPVPDRKKPVLKKIK